VPPVYREGSAPSRIGWELPPVYCPFNEFLIHPKADELETRAVEWLDSHGLYPDATERAWGLAARAADFTSRIAPYGDPEAMLLFAQWNYWGFATDDSPPGGRAGGPTAHLVDAAARMVRSVETPGSALLPSTPHTRALLDLVSRTRDMLTPFQLRRFTEGIRDWLLGEAWQTSNDERGVMPGLDEFCAMRMSVNGTRFTLTWCDVVNGIDLPADVLYSAPVQALTDAAGFVVSCDNDVFSYNKDDHQEPLEQNLVNVLAREDGRTPIEALPRAVAVRDRALVLFLRLGEQLTRNGDEQLRRYVESLRHWIAGDAEYHNRAPRYASPRNRNDLPVEGASYDVAWRETPSDPSVEPLPVPAFAWWWEQLDA
jgi:hypothetical protein